MSRKRSRVRAEVGFLLTVVGLLAVSMLATMFIQPTRSQAGSRAVVAAGIEDSAAASLYSAKCAGCHQPDGAGVPGTFPPLAGNPAAADAEYVADVITNGRSGPIEVLGVTYDGEMPAIAGLTDDEVVELSEFVAALASGEIGAGDPAEAPPEETQPDVPPPPAAPPEFGDADRGRGYFTGSTGLDTGAAACASCHTAGDVGNLGGSSLGPDLTGVYDRLGGEAGLSAWLANPASPTMAPIFADRPLTEAEIADLVAFLAGTPDQDKPSYPVDWLVIAGIAGFAVLIGGMTIAWRGMRQTYVQTLRSKR